MIFSEFVRATEIAGFPSPYAFIIHENIETCLRNIGHPVSTRAPYFTMLQAISKDELKQEELCQLDGYFPGAVEVGIKTFAGCMQYDFKIQLLIFTEALVKKYTL